MDQFEDILVNENKQVKGGKKREHHFKLVIGGLD